MIKRMFACMCLSLVLLLAGSPLAGHLRETTAVTWNQTISRIIIERCGSCHYEGGSTFSLMTYDDARPWAVSIREEILSRSMPPWGAVKGFGTFRNDGALSPAQTNMILSWIEGGVPEGDPGDRPNPPEVPETGPIEYSPDEILVSGETTLEQSVVIDGLRPREVPREGSLQITAQFPDGRVEPLLWLYEYREEYGHPFLFETPLELPPGTMIQGIPAGSSVALIPTAS